MTITIFDCPFCGSDNVVVDEIELGIVAICCNDCQTIGPHTDGKHSTTAAIEKWNKAPRWPAARMIRIEPPRRDDREPDDRYAAAMEAGENPWIG